MNRKLTIALGVTVLLYTGPAALAQNAPPTYQGDPSVYKVIFEDENFRVIEVVRKAGVHDKLHSHPVPSVAYYLTDCKTKLYDGNGKFLREGDTKAGSVRAGAITAGHSAENSGPADCREISVEKK
jgi:hypothetical protein